jgi:Zn-dependent protease
VSGPDPGDRVVRRDRDRRDGAAGGRRSPSPDDGLWLAGLWFSYREVVDFLAAWAALSVAFTAFFFGTGALLSSTAPLAVGVSLLTCGVGFVLHELAHKVVAVRFGQVAGFRADYGMLFLSVAAALGGFFFAAPGAVYHRGRITTRENGQIALAGPVTNLVLAGVFGALLALPGPGLLVLVGQVGVLVNAFLAGFNLIPFGPLDGKSVREWHLGVWALFFVVSAGLTVAVLLVFGFLGSGGLPV